MWDRYESLIFKQYKGYGNANIKTKDYFAYLGACWHINIPPFGRTWVGSHLLLQPHGHRLRAGGEVGGQPLTGTYRQRLQRHGHHLQDAGHSRPYRAARRTAQRPDHHHSLGQQGPEGHHQLHGGHGECLQPHQRLLCHHQQLQLLPEERQQGPGEERPQGVRG